LVEERTAQLTQEITNRKKTEERLGGILNSIRDHISIVDEGYNVIWANDTAKRIFGKDIIGMKCYRAYHGRSKKCLPCAITKTFRDGKVYEHETEVIDKKGHMLSFWCTSAVVSRYPDKKVKTVIEVSRDITEQKKILNTLKERDQELTTKSKTLEEVNTALRVMLKQREEDKKDLEEKFVSNIREMILLYVHKIQKGRLDPKHRAYIDIVETNLKEIVSPYLNTIRQFNFTPREIEVTSLIRNGKTTKEIAEIMDVAPSAIDSHRNNIRKKLGLNNKKVNLFSHLLSLR
jgi:PAS domain S-box-containing protein